jgi:high frequency lysogenization protein
LNSTSVEFSDWEYRNIALAAVTQCALLVHDLAINGTADEKTMLACLRPVYLLDPDSIHQVYPDVSQFNDGVQVLQRSFDSAGMRENAETVRYLLGMLVLQQRLSKAPTMLPAIRDRLQQLTATEGQPPLTDDLPQQAIQADCSALARLYQDTVSKLSFRIHVSGNPEHLRDHAVADQIRALLLAGIRSAVLWHQLGGRRWHLVFYKKRIRECLTGIRRKFLK